MKPLKEILRSPRFLREVYLLLFFFAVVSGGVGVLLFLAAVDAETLGMAFGAIIQAIVYVVLGILIRRGSIGALWIAGALFLADTLFQLTQMSGNGLKAIILTRGVLIFLLIRFIRREQHNLDIATELGNERQ